MRFATLKFLVCLLFPLLLISCEEEKEVCDDCQDAIDHMFHKIESNNCDPDLMGNAMTRLSDDCGLFSARAFAGVMAHSCANEDFTRRPDCISNSDDILTSSLFIKNVQIEIHVLSTKNVGDTVQVEFAENRGGVDVEGLFSMKAGDFADHFVTSLPNGAEIDVIVLDPNTEDVLIQKTVINRFWRSGYWAQIRQVQVQYIPLLDEYDIIFSDW